ncbi:MAG: site-2 protease family protein [Caldilineaceae bacterium]
MADQSPSTRFHPFRELSATEAQALSNELRALVANDLAVESIQTTRDQRQGSVVVQGRLLRPSHAVFPHWLAKLNERGYTPMLRPRTDSTDPNEVTLHVMAGVAPKQRSNPWINLVLFIITVISTLWVGSLTAVTSLDNLSSSFLPQNLIQGWPFALTLLGILTAHEFGHYFAARYHKVAVTLPYFLPMPFGFGTLGAFIRLKEPIPDRRKLFDIGVAGPLAGVVLAIPLLFIGLQSTPVDRLPDNQGYMLEGNSLLYYYAKVWTFGRPLPDPVTHEDVQMDHSPVAWGAWIGLLVTALNLLPVGQLDGGHTVFALFGKKSRYANQVTLGAMALFAVAGLPEVQHYAPFLEAVGFTGWFVWLALIFFLIGPYHPPALDDVTTLDPPRRFLGYLVIFLFIITFIPVPLRTFM